MKWHVSVSLAHFVSLALLAFSSCLYFILCVLAFSHPLVCVCLVSFSAFYIRCTSSAVVSQTRQVYSVEVDVKCSCAHPFLLKYASVALILLVRIAFAACVHYFAIYNACFVFRVGWVEMVYFTCAAFFDICF